VRPLLAALLVVAAPVAVVQGAAPETVECAAAVTRDLGPRQTLRDLDPTVLPVLDYKAEPKEREFKPLPKLGDVRVGVYVYRVNDAVAHVQIFEYGDKDRAVLADTALNDEVTELTFRPPGGTDMVTVYCYW